MILLSKMFAIQLFALLVLISLSAGIQSTIQCVPYNDTSQVKNCTVRTNEILIFDCASISSNALWYKNGSLSPLCSQSTCTLKSSDIGYIETSGSYYCKGAEKYYVNIEVISGPEYIRVDSPVKCFPLYCAYQTVSQNVGPIFLNFTVKVVGKGPFTYSWHNGSMTATNLCDTTQNCSSLQLGHNEYSFTFIMQNPRYTVDGAMYANISNKYGYNMSKIVYYVDCDTDPISLPLSPVQSSTLYYEKGANVNINCSMQSNMLTRMGICYYHLNQDFADIVSDLESFNESCTICTPSSHEKICTDIITKPYWDISMSIGLDQNNCRNKHIVNINIRNINMSDSELKFQCFYQNNDASDRKQFQYWYEVHVVESKRWFVWLSFLSVILIVAAIVIILLYYCHKKRKRVRMIKLDQFSTNSDDSGIGSQRDVLINDEERTYVHLPYDDYGSFNPRADPSTTGTVPPLDPYINSNINYV